MDEVMQLLPTVVANAGGSIEWNDFVAAVPPRQQRHIMPALQQLEANNVIRRTVDGTVFPPVFRVVTVQPE